MCGVRSISRAAAGISLFVRKLKVYILTICGGGLCGEGGMRSCLHFGKRFGVPDCAGPDNNGARVESNSCTICVAVDTAMCAADERSSNKNPCQRGENV